MTWKHPSRKLSGRNNWATVWDHKVVRLLVICHHGDTVTAMCYGGKLTGLRRTITCKRPGLLHQGVIILHNNARRHCAAQHVTGDGTTAGSLWTTIPTSRRLVLDFIGSLKKHLAGKRFVRDARVRQVVTTLPKPLDMHLVCAWIQALASRWNN
jgi:hypothetical protein